MKKFVQDTLSLELRGVRWRELNGNSSSQEYYSRFLWPADAEPGWDLLFVADATEVTSVTPNSTRTVEEYESGDVRQKQEKGFDVDIVFNDMEKFSREKFEVTAPSKQTFFVIERAGKLLFVERLHPPRLSSAAALKVLESSAYRSSGLDALRARLRKRAMASK